MAQTHRAPKQWSLGTNETVNTFEAWRQNLIYTLSLDDKFTPFLVEGATWQKKTRDNATHRGLINDGDTVPEARRLTAIQKAVNLELMLGQIANFCPIIARNSIVKNSTSLDKIWQTIRLHFGFQSTGAHFLDLNEINQLPDEKPEDLFQRLYAFFDDNLLRRNGGISHHDENITEDEEIQPTLENTIVFLWLKLIHNDLPKLIKQRYGTELRSRTLASIKPEISQALPSLLEELQANATILRTFTFQSKNRSIDKKGKFRRNTKLCPLCQQAGRPEIKHFLTECKYLPEQDRKYIAKARQVAKVFTDSEDEDDQSDSNDTPALELASRRIQVRQSPFVDMFCRHHTVRITIDSGATGNMIRASTANMLGAKITKSTQLAHQADGSSPLVVVGETKLNFNYGSTTCSFSGLVVENLDVDVLAGTPFMEENDISVRPARRQVLIGNGIRHVYGNIPSKSAHSVRRAHIVRAQAETSTIWPGDFMEVELPNTCDDSQYAIEPLDSSSTWPAHDIIHSIAQHVRIPNMTDLPVVVRRSSHVCRLHEVFEPSNAVQHLPGTNIVSSQAKTCHSSLVSIDPDNSLPSDYKGKFTQLLHEFDEVFNPVIKGYNGASGPFEASVNMGPTQPPQRKGRMPLYSQNRLQELQDKCDSLEAMGILRKPEDIGIQVEYLNPSFLVNKSSGGTRLVTAFADVGRYSKPQPSLLPNVDSILRQIAQWKYIIASDLSMAFYQIPLRKDSMKYCGIATPYKGVRVYVRSAMGMPGSETALEELLCRVLGDCLQDGIVTKLADDLYCGANSVDELFINWRRVLTALEANNLCLSASKTVIAPTTTTVLGWVWNQGTIRASTHRLSSLATCDKPKNTKAMRSFIGAFKVLSRVLPGCSSYMSPLDEAIAGKQSGDPVEWNDQLHASFKSAQDALKTCTTITLPQVNDQLWIVTDGAVRNKGIGATLYAVRKDDVKVAGFYSAKLKCKQHTWLPCEVEALSIAMAINHFSPYLIDSANKACILTDSKPCVQAYEKLCRGEFSASPRVSTYLSTVSRFQASVRHIAGVANLPSDHASRNPAECEDPKCQVCTFISRAESCVVRRSNLQDFITGKKRPPFTNRKAWSGIQAECPDLRRVHAHLKQGTRPSKKLTNIKDVKRYLQVATIARDGLLVVKKDVPFESEKELIVVPRSIIDGLVCALHVQMDHPSAYQLKSILHRYMYALDMDSCIEKATKGCHACAATMDMPHVRVDQSTGDPPECIGAMFAADVVKRERQLILLVRDYVSSFTLTRFIDDERQETLRDSLIILCLQLRPLDGPYSVIRTDGAPGFQALLNDPLLQQHRLSIELGRVKNKNKNPVADKAIRELEQEILKVTPQPGRLTSRDLAVATARLNERIRNRGISAREFLQQRDQFTNCQIPLLDQDLIQAQHQNRVNNHENSSKSKAPNGRRPPQMDINIGDIVYIFSDKDKNHARDRYIVCGSDPDGLYRINKFHGNKISGKCYRVKKSEVYKVQSDLCTSVNELKYVDGTQDSDSESVHDQPISISENNTPIFPSIRGNLNPPVLQTASSVGNHPVVQDTGAKNSLPVFTDSDNEDNPPDNPPDPPDTCAEVRPPALPGIPSVISLPENGGDLLQNSGSEQNKDSIICGDNIGSSRPKRVRKVPVWHKDYVIKP